MKWRENAPEHAEARPIDVKGHAACGECGKRLAHTDQWRCPWVGCRKWLRGLADEPARLSAAKTKEAA
jgi:hypothetical protein